MEVDGEVNVFLDFNKKLFKIDNSKNKNKNNNNIYEFFTSTRIETKVCRTTFNPFIYS